MQQRHLSGGEVTPVIAALDDGRWPATSGLIDEFCGAKSNTLVTGEGAAPEDVNIFFARFRLPAAEGGAGEGIRHAGRVHEDGPPRVLPPDRRPARGVRPPAREEAEWPTLEYDFRL